MKKLLWLVIPLLLSSCAKPDYREMAQDTGAGAGISTWTAQTDGLAVEDLFAITDYSDKTGSDPDGTSKKLTYAQLQTNLVIAPPVVTTDGSESPTMQALWYIADHATATSDTTYTLAGVAAGESGCFYDNGEGAGGIIINPDDADYIINNGTVMAVGEALESPGVAGDGENGDFVCLLGISATHWITLGASGTWVEETPP